MTSDLMGRRISAGVRRPAGRGIDQTGAKLSKGDVVLSLSLESHRESSCTDIALEQPAAWV